MKRGQKTNSQSQSVEVMDFLTELARMLVNAGISHDQFAQASEFAFVRAASRQARFQNSKVNQSAVAAMTGLNRTKIRALIKDEAPRRKGTENRIDRIISAWVSEAELLTASGEPRRLKVSGPRGTFSWLVRRHGGDIPPKAMLGELIRRRVVRVEGELVILSATARKTREAKRLSQVSRALASVLRLPPMHLDSRSVRVSSVDIVHQSTTAVGRVVLQQRISRSLRAFAAEVEAACAAVALESPAATGSKKRQAKTSIFLMSQD